MHVECAKMGEGALKSHTKSDNHKEAIAPTILSQTKFERLSEKLYDMGFQSALQSDQAKEQFTLFKSQEAITHQEDFKTFDYGKNRLDEFHGQYLDRNIKYTHLWNIMKFVFVLPHGQARVEKGFNINDDISATDNL